MGGFQLPMFVGLLAWLAPVTALWVISHRLGQRRLALLPVIVTVVWGLPLGYFVGWYDGAPSVQHALNAFVVSFTQGAMLGVWLTSIALAVSCWRSGKRIASLGRVGDVVN